MNYLCLLPSFTCAGPLWGLKWLKPMMVAICDFRKFCPHSQFQTVEYGWTLVNPFWFSGARLIKELCQLQRGSGSLLIYT